MTCKNPEHDIYPYYGLAPHKHIFIDDKSLSTVILNRDEWPSNYVDIDNGAGVWHCPDCFKLSLTSK